MAVTEKKYHVGLSRDDVGDYVRSMFPFDYQWATVADAKKLLYEYRKIHAPLTNRHFASQLTLSFR